MVVKEASDVCPPLKAAVGGFLACVDVYQVRSLLFEAK